MADRHRMAATFAGQPRRVQERGQALPVQGRRHHHDAQVLAQPGLHVQRQRQAQVGGQVALVELVEQQGADALQLRVVLDHPGQDAFGDHLDPGARRHPVLEADPVADRLADLLAELAGHEHRRAARRHPPRLQHHDPAPGQPRRIEQGQRHLGGLAGARRCLQHQPRMRGQAVADRWQQRGDGKVAGFHPHKDTGPPPTAPPCGVDCCSADRCSADCVVPTVSRQPPRWNQPQPTNGRLYPARKRPVAQAPTMDIPYLLPSHATDRHRPQPHP